MECKTLEGVDSLVHISRGVLCRASSVTTPSNPQIIMKTSCILECRVFLFSARGIPLSFPRLNNGYRVAVLASVVWNRRSRTVLLGSSSFLLTTFSCLPAGQNTTWPLVYVDTEALKHSVTRSIQWLVPFGWAQDTRLNDRLTHQLNASHHCIARKLLSIECVGPS